jgi:3-dehydroquinate synthase
VSVHRTPLSFAARRHEVVSGAGVLQRLGHLLREVHEPCRVALITDDGVAAAGHVDTARDALREQGFGVHTIVLPAGEEAKTLDQAERIWSWLVQTGFERRDVVVALGGGTVGDVAGFCAATFQRGIDLVQVPTTLLAMADSAVGGKTGINLAAGKNLVGAFKLPILIAVDVETLATLPERDIRSGMAEVLKCAVLADRDALERFSEQVSVLLALDADALNDAVVFAVETKAGLVAEDLHDVAGRRALLNLGHTTAHALEAEVGYGRLRHGEAVSVGLMIAARLAVQRGVGHEDLQETLRAALNSFGLPTGLPLGVDADGIVERTRFDKKRDRGRRRMVLPVGSGGADLFDVSDEELRAAL